MQTINPQTWLAKDLLTGNLAFGRTMLEAAVLLVKSTAELRAGERVFYVGRAPKAGAVTCPTDLATLYAVSAVPKVALLLPAQLPFPAWANDPVERTAWFGPAQRPKHVGVYQRNLGSQGQPRLEFSCWDGKRWLAGKNMPNLAGRVDAHLPHAQQQAPWCGLRRDPCG